MTRPVAFSYSRLDSFENCPKKYWSLSVGKTVKDLGNEHSQYGDMVHQSIKQFMVQGTQLPLQIRHLTKYLAPIKASPGKLIVEQKLAIDANYEGCDWFDKAAYCRVISDLTIINGKRAIMFDWKTGKMKDEFLQLRLAGAVVMLLAEEIEEAQLVYFWTKTKKFTRDPERLTRDDIAKVFNGLAPRLQRYQDAHASESFPARPNPLCRFCPVTSCQYNEAKK
jgi:hypothetical protein